MHRLFFLAMIILIMASCATTSEWRVAGIPDLKLGNINNYAGNYKIGSAYFIQGKKYQPQFDPSYQEMGVASWYGPNFHGKLTANGEIYNQRALTAAHRTLPMPSMVRVTNVDNGREVMLMVNDRGPFAKDRIIDVSEQGAEILGFKQHGTANVKVEYLPLETEVMLKELGLYESYSSITKQRTPMLAKVKQPPQNHYYGSQHQIFVQLGAFSKLTNARSMLGEYQHMAKGTIRQKVVDNKNIYKAQLGPYNKFAEAQNILNKLREMGNNQAMIVANN